jgi:hypothetical protein
MTSPNSLLKILRAASAVLVLAACADHPTAPDATSSIPNTPDARAVKFWEVGSSVGWNGVARGFLTAPGRAFNPFIEARVLTYLSLAQYNAIVAAENSETPGIHPSRAGAAAGASVIVLKEFFPAAAQLPVLIDDHLAAQKAGPIWPGEKHQDFAAGEAIGRAIGNAVVAYARSDNTGLSGLPEQRTGTWTSSTAPIVLGLLGTRPLALSSADQFRSRVPPTFESALFLADLAEVQALSNSHTGLQVDLARFWNTKVARYQNEIAAEMIVSHRRSEREAAHILALANVAGFDALIGCWDAKFAYWYARPWHVDGSIHFPIGRPNHPSYPSGHSCVTAAFSEILGQTFPDERPGLAANVEAAGQSRINGGLHYRFDLVEGQVLGRKVAEYVLATDVASHEPIPLD